MRVPLDQHPVGPQSAGLPEDMPVQLRPDPPPQRGRIHEQQARHAVLPALVRSREPGEAAVPLDDCDPPAEESRVGRRGVLR